MANTAATRLRAVPAFEAVAGEIPQNDLNKGCSMADANLVFLPWVRQGMAARLTTPDPLAAPLPAQAGFNARLEINGEEGATMPLIIAGAGEVIGLDARQVVRMEPPPNTSDYESNDLAAVEFDNPDLPWLFTPAAADAQGRLRPWLVLVVVRQGDGVVLRPPGTEALPVLEIAPPARPADELPDLAESWAWTHAQLAAPAGASTDALLSLLATQPAHSVARLVSPRLLDPFTRYIACVVPAFEAGRLAGLKLPITGANASQLAPAWKSGANAPAQIALPVFHHWEFATGAREDFESLVRKLVPRDLAGLVGRRPMSLDQPGFPVGDTPLPALDARRRAAAGARPAHRVARCAKRWLAGHAARHRQCRRPPGAERHRSTGRPADLWPLVCAAQPGRRCRRAADLAR